MSQARILAPLPVDAFVPEMRTRLTDSPHLIVTAEPGTGKTTRLPPALLDFVPGTVLVLEPRRMAAVAAAHRIAEERGWVVGREVGYQVRFDSKIGPATRLIFLTEALLLRRMLSDPELSGVDAVFLDEFHERSLNVDLALGSLKELNELGRNLKIVVMSATLQTDALQSYLNGASVLKISGERHPLDIRHQKGSLRLRLDPEFFDLVTKKIREAFAEGKKDLLVFLPGVREIEQTAERLVEWSRSAGADVLALHGSLPLEEQRRALARGPRRRVILATNVAESSVTVDGVDTVIDSGLAKILRMDPKTGFSRLSLSRISLASADQRAGRAARQGPGICHRLWSAADEASFARAETPEVQRIDISEALLFLAAQGVGDVSGFSWFEPPAPAQLARARFFLKALGALDDGDRITPLGQRLMRFPLPPRLARLMTLAEDLGIPEIGADVAALLQERDIARRGASEFHIGDRWECDVTWRWNLLQSYKRGVRERDLLTSVASQVVAAARKLRDLAQPASSRSDRTPEKVIKDLLLHSHSDRICRRRKGGEKALMVGGRGVRLASESLVRDSEYFVAVTGQESATGADTLIAQASGLRREQLEAELGSAIAVREDLFFDEIKGTLYHRKVRAIWDLPLEEPQLTTPDAAEIEHHLAGVLSQRLDWVRSQNPELERWLSRWEFFSRYQTAWARFWEDEDRLRRVFQMACFGERSLAAVTGKNLVYFFESELGADAAGVFESWAPDRYQVPSGSRLTIEYPADKGPFLEVRIQEIFGLLESPKIAGGQVALTFHLLGPNFRPVQVTSDLASFWRAGYQEVRKELRARYPKHSWPEDPYTARPEAKGRRRV